MIRLWFTLILMTVNCYAGVDLRFDSAMTGRQKVYKIPDFKSKEDALDWANRVKWIEPLRQQLEGYVARMGRLYDMEHHTILSDKYYHQWERGTLALRIIENYKRLKIPGNEAMVGSSFYAGEIPW